MEGVKNAICVVICSEKMWACLKCFVCNKDKKFCNQKQSVGGVTNVRMCFCARYMFYCIAEMHGLCICMAIGVKTARDISLWKLGLALTRTNQMKI